LQSLGLANRPRNRKEGRRLPVFGAGILLLCAVALPIAASERATGPSEPYVLGVNFPWVKYGLDFGESGFGRYGLSTDCAQGFRPERFAGSDGVRGCRRSQNRVRNGRYSLQVFVDIAGMNPSLPPSGEVTTDLQDIAHVPQDFSADLDGGSVSAWVYVPAGLRGEESSPNFFQLFAKDASAHALGLYSDPFEIPAAGGWLRLELKVRAGPSGWDPKRVRLIGVKVGIGGKSSARLNGTFYVDQIESTAPEVAFDFEQASRAEFDADQLQVAGVRTLRWFVFSDGRASPEFDAQGRVTGLDAAFFRDFDAMLVLARDHKLRIVPVLFDFLLCGDRQELNGVQLYGRADLIRDSASLESFLTNALGPLLDRYGAAPEIAAWEVMNEPEWCLSDVPLPPNARPHELPPGGAVTLQQMRSFLQGIAEFIRGHPSSGTTPITLGSASDRFLALWNGLGIDLCQFHLYNCKGCLDEGRGLPPVHQCLLGEFAALASKTDRSVSQYLEDTCRGGYAGAMPWSWRGRDFVSPIGAQQQARLLDQIREFATTSACLPPPATIPCVNGPTALCLHGDRFRVQTEWETPRGERGIGEATRLTGDTGYFWFFAAENVEVLVKVLDGCGVSSHFWVFAGGLTNVHTIIRVEDTRTGVVRVYENPPDTAFQPIQDTAAFATCP
jgi:hypothetical protein